MDGGIVYCERIESEPDISVTSYEVLDEVDEMIQRVFGFLHRVTVYIRSWLERRY